MQHCIDIREKNESNIRIKSKDLIISNMAKRVIFQDEDKFEFKGQMKELTGGDSLFPDDEINHFRESNAIYARSLKYDPSDWIPDFRLILTCNKLPQILYDDPVICKRKNLKWKTLIKKLFN